MMSFPFLLPQQAVCLPKHGFSKPLIKDIKIKRKNQLEALCVFIGFSNVWLTFCQGEGIE